jgi:hypothetical protein
MAKMTLDKVHETVELAGVYAFDGAFFTAAAKLKQAAEMMQELAEQDARDLAELSK